MKGENSQAIKNYIKNKILEINNKELEEEIKIGKKTKMMNEVNRKYLENFNFEEARAIFMMLTRMIDVKANFKNKYRNLECEICRVEENTQHLFKCKKYHGLNENIKGETLSEVLQKKQHTGHRKSFKRNHQQTRSRKKRREIKEKFNKHRSPALRVEPLGWERVTYLSIYLYFKKTK